MALDEQRISLDISKQPTPQQVRLGQGDINATRLIVDVFDDGIAYSLDAYSVRLEMRLPDSDAYYSTDGTATGNTATFDIDETYAATHYGVNGFGYVDILDGDTVICSTSRFQLVVLRNAKDGADLSTAYSNDIIEATERAIAAAEAAEGVVLQDVPTMSQYVKGGAKLGEGLTVEDETLSLSGESFTAAEKTKLAGIEDNANNYSLPTMGASTKGGAKVGSGLAVSNDVLSVDASGVDSGALPIAHGGTGATTAAQARASLDAASATDLDALVAKGIGTRKAVSPSTSSCANNTWKEVASISLESGVWVVTYGGAFDTNATGHRDLHFDSSAPGAGRYSPLVAAVSGEQTRMNATTILTTSSTTTFRLYARQNSGGALDFYAYIQAGKIG